MISKKIKIAFAVLTVSVFLTSCYPYRCVVGKGAQGSQEVTQWNNYVIYGLIPIGVSDAKQMAAGATDYTVFTRHSFVNGLLTAITFGIYSPTTTTVTK